MPAALIFGFCLHFLLLFVISLKYFKRFCPFVYLSNSSPMPCSTELLMLVVCASCSDILQCDGIGAVPLGSDAVHHQTAGLADAGYYGNDCC